MTEALSLATASAADRRQSVSASPIPPYHHHSTASLQYLDGTVEDDDGEIACICTLTEDDGNTIQCDSCLRWQHIVCYYPQPKDVPGEDQKHYCKDCVPQEDLDSKRAMERQRKALEQRRIMNGVKKPVSKSHKKKVNKDSPSLTAQVNGWPSDRVGQLQNHDRKSASPRDQPPPAKRPKTSHRPSGSVSHGRKRAGTVNTSNTHRSPSKSPDAGGAVYIPHYSDEFMQLFQPQSPQVDTDTNLMNNIAVTNSLSQWLTDSEAVGKATGGLTPSEIFKRWDGQMEDIPGRPGVELQWMEDPRYKTDTAIPRWARLTVENEIAPGTFIGELRGRIGDKDDYIQDPDSRWTDLRHPEPFVFFHPQLPIVIDARQEGSIFRFVRRSCQPNAELQTIITEGTEYHFCFMATKDILPGDEVTVAWQVPEMVRDRINSSLANATSFQPNVRNYITKWVSKVLANCGPCACNGQSNCLMAHYDSRGQTLPPDSIPKKSGRRKRNAHLEAAIPSRSRSTSEAPKLDQDDDGTDSRSVSGSRGSVSRDITPNTHYSTNTANGIPEMSERERKKLMREEEMFRKQEEETGRQHKKKRNSGGPNLNTSTAATPVRWIPDTISNASSADASDEKQHGYMPLAPPRYTDVGTSSHKATPAAPRQTNGKRKNGPSSKTPRKVSANSTRPPRPTYVDASVQCDLETNARAERAPYRPRRRYVSVTQRLLQICISNNFAHKAVVHKMEPAAESTDMAMDVDDEVSDAAVQNHVVSSSPKMANPSPPRANQASSPHDVNAHDQDVKMTEAEPERDMNVKSPTLSVKSLLHTTTSSPTIPEDSAGPSHPPMDPPPPPWPQISSSPERKRSSSPALGPPSNLTITTSHRPTMHVDMPPPSVLPFGSSVPSLTPQTTSGSNGTPMVQSPSALTPGALNQNAPLFSPSVTAAIAPSPIRKKLSLSDYTRRREARESAGETSTSVPGVSIINASPPADNEANKENEEVDDGADSAVPTADKVAEIVEKAKEAAREEADKVAAQGEKAQLDNESAVLDGSATPAVAPMGVPPEESVIKDVGTPLADAPVADTAFGEVVSGGVADQKMDAA